MNRIQTLITGMLASSVQALSIKPVIKPADTYPTTKTTEGFCPDEPAPYPFQSPAYSVINTAIVPPLSCSVNANDELFDAIQTGELTKVKNLLSLGISIDAPLDEQENSALHTACKFNQAEAIDLLLNAGANIFQKNKGGLSPFNDKSINPHIKNKINEHLSKINKMHNAIRQNNITAIDELLGSGMSANVLLNESKDSPLKLATYYNHTEIVEKLIDAGANPNLANKDGLSPLYIASEKGRIEIVEKLLAAGADPNKADKDGVSPLYIASQNGHTPIVEKLLAAGADPNTATSNGVTPLYIASQNGHKPIVEKLLAAGADPNKATLNGFSPLNVAIEVGHTQIVEKLISAGAHTAQLPLYAKMVVVFATTRVYFLPLLLECSKTSYDFAYQYSTYIFSLLFALLLSKQLLLQKKFTELQIEHQQLHTQKDQLQLKLGKISKEKTLVRSRLLKSKLEMKEIYRQLALTKRKVNSLRFRFRNSDLENKKIHRQIAKYKIKIELLSSELNESYDQNNKLKNTLERLNMNQTLLLAELQISDNDMKSFLEQLKSYFICAISTETLDTPVATTDGHLYSLRDIEDWFETHNTSPNTGNPLANKSLIPIHTINSLLNYLKISLDQLAET